LIDNVRLNTIPAVPQPPANLTATSNRGVNYVVLSWQDTAGDETGFLVQRSSDGVHWSTIARLASSVTSYHTAKPAAGHTYFYRVLATNAAGNSGPSNVVSVSG
jgi:titin